MILQIWLRWVWQGRGTWGVTDSDEIKSQLKILRESAGVGRLMKAAKSM